MSVMKRTRSLTAEERKYLRQTGEMPGRDATDLEMMMYRTCVEMRLSEFYREDDKEARRLLRTMIRAMAVTLVWKKSQGQEIVLVEDVKAMEKEFMRRAREDPPF
jgi:hypothetical protein